MKKLLAVLLVLATFICAVPVGAQEIEAAEPFDDVNEEQWFYDQVVYVFTNNIFKGITNTEFEPDTYMTRGMFVTVLSRVAGDYNVDSYTGSSFKDIAEDAWYSKPVEWAYEKGIVNGTGVNEDGEMIFSPDDSVTREQMAKMMYLFAGDYYDTTDVRQSAYDRFHDTDKTADWAEEAMVWMTTCELINGMGANVNGAPTLNPQGTATRAQVATILMNYKEMRYNADTAIGEVLIAGNDISKYTIVYGVTATVRGANSASDLATQLQNYIFKATGITLPVGADTETAAGDYEILIGKTNREGDKVNVDRSVLNGDGDALLMQIQGNYLILASTEEYSGTSYAVYEFCEQYLGYTFFGAIEIIASKNSVSVPGDLNYTETASIHFRMNHNYKGEQEDQLRNDINYYSFCNLVHTLPEFAVSPDIFEPTHSFHVQYFMSDDPCLTDETVQQNMIANVKTWLAKNGGTNRLIWVSQSDADSICGCANCGNYYREHGRASTYLEILNVVAKGIEDEYPDFYVVGLAYKQTYIAPFGFDKDEIDDSVIVCVCTDSSCSAHPLTSGDCNNFSNPNNDITSVSGRKISGYTTIFDAWYEVSPHIYIWDYINGDHYRHGPFPFIHQMYYNYLYFREKGAWGVYTLGDSDPNASFRELKTYLTSVLQWEDDLTWNEYSACVNNFLKAYYGDGWSYIREYIDVTYELAYHNEWHIWTKNKWDDVITYEQYLENYDYLRYLWDKAEELAATDEQKLNTKRSSIQIKYIEVCMAYEKYELSGDSADLEAFKALNFAYTDELLACDYKVPENWVEDLDPDDWWNT